MFSQWYLQKALHPTRETRSLSAGSHLLKHAYNGVLTKVPYRPSLVRKLYLWDRPVDAVTTYGNEDLIPIVPSVAPRCRGLWANSESWLGIRVY